MPTEAPGASISEPFCSQTEPPVRLMLPGVKLPPSDGTVWPFSSGRLVIRPLTINSPARRLPGCAVESPPVMLPLLSRVPAIASSTVEIVILPGVLTLVVTPMTPPRFMLVPEQGDVAGLGLDQASVDQ